MASHAALKEYFATLPQAKVPDVAPQFVSNAGAGLLEEKPAKVGIYRPPKVMRGLDVATVNDFPKHPGALLSLPGLPTDDMTAAINKLSRRVEDLTAKTVMFRRPPMVLRADFRPDVALSDIVAAFQQARRQEQELLFREGLLRRGVTPEEVRTLEAQQRIARALGEMGALAPPVVEAAAGRRGRRAAALPAAAAGGVEAAVAARGAVERPRGGGGAPRGAALPGIPGVVVEPPVAGPMDLFARRGGAAAIPVLPAGWNPMVRAEAGARGQDRAAVLIENPMVRQRLLLAHGQRDSYTADQINAAARELGLGM